MVRFPPSRARCHVPTECPRGDHRRRGPPVHWREMQKSAEGITFDLKPLQVREGWYIVITYPGGMQESRTRTPNLVTSSSTKIVDLQPSVVADFTKRPFNLIRFSSIRIMLSSVPNYPSVRAASAWTARCFKPNSAGKRNPA
jgi:hypothetical protein